MIAGRLEVRSCESSGSTRLVAHLVRGDCGGEMSLITGGVRNADVVAVRGSLLAHLDKSDFDELVAQYPDIGMNLARFSISRLSASAGSAPRCAETRSIALVPLDRDVPIEELARRLELALLRFGSTIRLDRRTVMHRIGVRSGNTEPELDSTGALERLFDDAENSRRFVIYQAEADVNDWSMKCLAQVDRVLFVAHDSSSVELRPIEREIYRRTSHEFSVEKDLVILHDRQDVAPTGTAAWLLPRQVDHHYHVSWKGRSGVCRLARFLAGKAVTLVLGGGGARGFAQIGAIRAIREAGVPIDAVGGSSVGAILAAAVASAWQEDEQILQILKRALVDERPLNDFTVPVFALLQGKKASRSLARWFGPVDIVDLWVPYFCVTTNLSKSVRVVHRSGTLWKAVRSSVSIPGILPPFLYDGELHVDGGIIDNLPVGVMRSSFDGSIIAIDPSVSEEQMVNRDTVPSPLEFLWERMIPSRDGKRFPTLSSVLIKSTTVAGSSFSTGAGTGADLYLNPPAKDFDFLDWNRIYELAELGYRYTQESLPAWISNNRDVVQHDEMFEFRSSAAEAEDERLALT